MTVAILFPTSASVRDPVELAMINREFGLWPLFTVTGVTSVDTQKVAEKRTIWGMPVLFFWAGCGVAGMVFILVVCTVIMLCPNCHNPEPLPLQERRQMQTRYADPPFPTHMQFNPVAREPQAPRQMLPRFADPPFQNQMQFTSAAREQQAQRQMPSRYVDEPFQNQGPTVEQSSYTPFPIFYA